MSWLNREDNTTDTRSGLFCWVHVMGIVDEEDIKLNPEWVERKCNFMTSSNKTERRNWHQSKRYDDIMTNSPRYTLFPLLHFLRSIFYRQKHTHTHSRNVNANYEPNNERKIKLNKLNCTTWKTFNMMCNCRSAFCFWWILIFYFHCTTCFLRFRMLLIFYEEM